uniref:Methyltransferase n=1 Tax=Hirondellea gigas TaxID=1518452 RepID=A0A2P2I359_9CRUS
MGSVWRFIVSRFVSKDQSAESSSLSSKDYTESAKNYAGFFENKDGSEDMNAKNRQKDSNTVAKHYYDLATDFYEYGWGDCFHFAPRYLGESLEASLVRHEFFLASKIGINKGHQVLDAGCGIMGPARNISRFSGANVCGLNLNAYQVRRSNRLNARTNINSRLSCVEGNFAKTEFANNSFDHIYSIEAFCHAPDRLEVYQEMYRLLKPGGRLGIYDWVMTDKYDENDPEQLHFKHFIEKGNGIANMLTATELTDTLKKTGFTILECTDLAEDEICRELGNDVTWFEPFLGKYRCSQQIMLTPTGRWITQKVLEVLDFARIAPKGTANMHHILTQTAAALSRAGHLGIFTPMLFILVEKPAAAAAGAAAVS